eukprot:CAMPEP_0181295900 /NCGR_PEP_ID=MMETSP1101-20121128/4401_1 /TAXON_ID=46948 /ORGANISM="Rhodomonas abbreviata, Strain Caron Lab Isolate" /LENGTH=278 /DNA_ID=CAMNT_0023400697 /DNA_START=392 /DNA_END=1225 /DNA_ORIENTATION=+
MSPSAPKFDQPPRDLNVYVFLTFIGWGKNTFLNSLVSLEPADLIEHFGQEEPPLILESDVIGGKKFWREVQSTIRNETLGAHLVLNKNFPPNAWQGAKRRLKDACLESNRNLILHAVLPRSRGAPRNAFSLVDLSVCLAGVQTRTGHPNIDSSSNFTSKVAASFYTFYNHPGGRKGFVESVRKELTERVILVDWMKSSLLPACPPTVVPRMKELLRRAWECRDRTLDVEAAEALSASLEQDMRAFYSEADVQAFLGACRLPPTAVVDSFLSSLSSLSS